MIYFKKKKIKNFILNLYIFFNSFLVKINCLIFSNKSSNIKVFFGGSLTGNVGGTLVKIKRLKQKFNNNNFNFNCVYLLSNSVYLNKSAIINIKNKNIPIIHNQNGVFYKGWYGDGWEEKNKEMSFQYKLADYVLYQSNFSKYCAEKFLGKREGPGEILYNAVDQNIFYPTKKRELNSELRILVTGKYQEHLYYSLEFILKILYELNKKNIPAIINFAGYFDPKVLNKLLSFAKKHDIEDKVNFKGSYNQENANLIYNSSDLYFYFVHQSNCPNSVIEAMSCGLPVVCSNTGGLPEIVNSYSGICLNTEKNWEKPMIPRADEAIIAVNKIINNYSDYSLNSINKVTKDHNIKNWINKHEEIFKKFL